MTKVQDRTKPLNVLIIGEYFPPDIGGAATRASNVTKGLLLNGCNVTVVTAFPHYPSGKVPKEFLRSLLRIENLGKSKVIRTCVLPLESKGLFNRLLVFCSFIISSLFALPFVGKFDIVWAANPDVFILLPAIAYGKLKRKPIATNVDDLLIEDLYDLGLIKRGSFVSKMAEIFAGILYHKVKAATPISPGYISTIEKYGVERSSIQVVRGGVDLAVFKPQPELKIGDKFVVLYSGGFSVAYDFDQIFQAAKLVKELDPNVSFIIQGMGELLPSMYSKVAELRLTNVKIINITLSRELVAKFLNQADTLILPLAAFKTPYRGMSSKLYEYQGVGKPIICCSDGLPASYVRETNSGLIVHPGDHEALVQAIIKLKTNPQFAAELGNNGLKCVRSEASIEGTGIKMKHVLDSAIA